MTQLSDRSTVHRVRLGEDETALLVALVDAPQWVGWNRLVKVIVDDGRGQREGQTVCRRLTRIALGNLVAIGAADIDPDRGWRATPDGRQLVERARGGDGS